MKRILIFGGNGFVGSVVAKKALQQGYFVTSISRSGPPETDEMWVNQVNWISADVFEPETWRNYLIHTDVVINTIGILVEKPQHQITYQRFNQLSAQIVAEEVKNAHVPLLIHLSARKFTHLFLQAYFRSKKIGEDAVLQRVPEAIIIRPSFIFGKKRQWTITQAYLLKTIKKIPGFHRLLKKLEPQTVEDVANEILDVIKK